MTCNQPLQQYHGLSGVLLEASLQTMHFQSGYKMKEKCVFIKCSVKAYNHVPFVDTA